MPARKLVSQLRSSETILAALAIEQQEQGRRVETQIALRWGLRAFVAAAGVAAFVVLALRPWQSEDIGAWRAAYYTGKTLEGEPELHRELDVAFDWKREPPTDSVPSDFFSLRLDSCLVLEEDARVSFMLVSDDGSRLLVDGEPLIDAWGGRKPRVKGESVSLSAGVHHLRVEYFEHVRNASLSLTASFDEDEAPQAIPAKMLEFPGMDFDEDEPCAGVR